MRFLVAAKPRKAQACVEHGPQKLSRIPAAYLSAFPCQFQHPVVLKELRLCLKYGAAQPIKRSQHHLTVDFSGWQKPGA